ncbi:hypothetical protein DTO027I6_6230 [Penicillium roqueforti]|uniref:uncharacterized protein n=1 Tax=Penicillium roqueforti TaxID=5082 RepID=UPI00190D5F64|nr:uncharacterized protein LCP9604111_5705 [Penicillium roqueforti]KAF9247996.1 hypothetical protein LCP9604111_5705 [Penicillium roqueforti]KAI2714879.1 hypothetical protein CBS147318_6456 [Penicillium roqueforti]KAI3128170.1 hypothetical protein CBS147330_5629 [Penicillium roqueforti]KAI3164981.1 hypothetical protein DTO039G3_6931 [Penicillium roqueforti]KAI3199676.1 hypothetical protein DTO027I6_6230 [Penicillium roqueforti]
MTRLRGGSIDDPDIAQSPGHGRTNTYRSKLPPNASDALSQNTIEVSDPSRVLPRYRDDRRRKFNGLVRRYKAQLLHGCDDPGCRTATCASHRRRLSEGPYRRYTELSARTLACYLASLDDPETGLCLNVPKPPPQLTVEDYHRMSLRRTRTLEAQTAAANRSPKPDQYDEDHPTRDMSRPAQDRSAVSKVTEGGSSPQVNTGSSYIRDLDHTAEQQLKDPKSFTQNLFDTISLRMVEWLPLRRAADALESKSKPLAPGTASYPSAAEKHHCDADKVPGRDVKIPASSTPANQPISQPRTPSSRTSASQPPAVELKFQNQHVKRLSISEVDHWRQSPRSSLEDKKKPEFSRKVPVASSDEFVSLPSPPALKHRPQKHRGRIGDVDSVPLKGHRKSQRRVSWDSQKLLDEVSPINNTRSKELMPPPRPFPSVNQSPSERKTKQPPVENSLDTIPLAQTITHLTPEIIDGLSRVMIESAEDADCWEEELDRIQCTGSFEQPDWCFATLRQREVFPFVAQSVFFVFSSPNQILRSFSSEPTDMIGTTFSRLDVSHLRLSLQRLFTICPWDIALHSLWSSLDKLFVPPRGFTSSGRPSRRSSRSSTMTGPAAPPIVPRRVSESASDHHMSDPDAAYIATIALFTLVSFLPKIDLGTWKAVVRMRAAGSVASLSDMRKLPSKNAQQAIEVTDRFEHELGLRLINRLVRALTARLAYHEISKARQVYSLDVPKQRRLSVLDRVIDYLSEQYISHTAGSDEPAESINPSSLIVEWLRTLFLREWDGNPEMARSSPAGGAVQILASMYKERNRLGLLPEDFHTPLLTERLDPLDMPVAWVGSLTNNRTMHLLSYSFLFPPSSLVIYFRALNYAAMTKSYEAAMTTTRHVTQTAFGAIQISDDPRLLTSMKTSMSTYLVIVVRRDNILSDALSQLWRREKRELMRPLKVQMGMDEGEEGLDHGGVQQEFFRLLMGQAFDPSYGMFTVDTRHRISWFQPCSLEPLYKFELIGLLMSIAIYNGLTLPVNLPTAFYRKMLGLKVKHLDHIRDGWPELSQGLDSLLAWKDGDVGDIFTRTYEFSFEAFGSVETVDMEKVHRDAAWPVASKVKITAPAPIAGSSAWMDVPAYCDPATLRSPTSMAVEETTDATPCEPAPDTAVKSVSESISLQSPLLQDEEAALVTNKNRNQFVKDYIFWLTDKSIRPQFEAFQRGFNTCLDRSALSIFSPEALKTVVEGIQSIDVDELEKHARYEGGFGPDHRVIRDFWDIVHEYPNEKRAQLLEFVTASDRVPVNGISSIMFVIQKNGVGDLRLPTSLTCFGRLLLPEYSSKETLATKLDKALENAQGFGVA